MNKNRTPRKRKKTHKKKFKVLNLIILMSFISVIATIFAYTVLLKDSKKIEKKIHTPISIIENIDTKDEIELEEYRKERLKKYLDKKILQNKEFEEVSKDSYKEYGVNKEKNIIDDNTINKIKEKLKNNSKDVITKEEKVFKKILEENKTTKIIKKNYKKNTNTKAKLILVIDDVSASSQVKSILKLNEKITMSFLPPTKTHKNSAQIAQKLPFFMIHIPLQASSAFKFQEKKTLNIDDSYETIEKYVKKLRFWYPSGKYVNNHTGSKFTSNDRSMDYLYKALKKYNFIFIDSRTTAKSVAKKYAKKYNMPYLARNVFLDNEQNFNYIQNQLKKAIKIAKTRGSALAIGHPYDITIKVLKESKYLFKDLELIYLYQSSKL